jgi:hypothetical protein
VSANAPLLEPRQADELLRELLTRAGGYVPGWLPAEGSPGRALLRIYARYLETLAERVNRAPEKSRLAFFDMLGISLMPTQAAVAPVVFRPISQLGDGRVPARTQVAASIPGREEPLVFETRGAIALAAARLVEVASFWPGKDAWSSHAVEALGGQPFRLFTKLQPVPHELYLAHDTHLALAGQAIVEVQFELARAGSEPVDLDWQYWDGELWRSFKQFAAPAKAATRDSLDGTDGLTRNGTVRLAADCAKTARTRVNGLSAFWVRARATEPLPPTPGRSLPVVDRITLRTVVESDGLQPDGAFVDGLKLDLSKSFYPFGQQPQPGTAFYLANEDAFAKPGAEVTLSAQVAATPLDNAGSGTKAAAPTLAAEYWNGGAWANLGPASSELNAFLGGTALTFTVPADLEPTRVNGQDGLWVRVRIVSGGFYRTNTISWSVFVDDEEVVNTIVVSETVPPALQDFGLAYRYESPQDGPRACMAYNDFQWLDRSQEAFWRGGTFEPFLVTEDRTPAVYFGFDRPLPADLISLYFDIEEQVGERAPVLRWEAFDGRDWLSVAVGDETANLARPGMVSATWPGERARASGEAVQAEGALVQLASAQQAAAFRAGDLLYIGEAEKGELVTVERVSGDSLTLKAPVGKPYQRVPIAVAMLPRFGSPRAWLRARLQADGEPARSVVAGVFFNAAWAEQVRTYEQEVVGSSNGEPNQVAFFRQTPVLPGELLEVRELSGPRAAVELPILLDELLARGLGRDAVRTVSDPRTGSITEVWVRWEWRPNLFFSGPDDRHYVVERSRGRVIFGDGVHGRIPAVGADNIRTPRYRSGGGVVGNVPAGALSQLLSGVPAAGVSNPRAAEGGADGESVEAVATRAPLFTLHRSQALSLEDYEGLAREASPAVAVARALPLTHPSGRPAPGWVKVIVQPHSQDPRPQPSFGLRRQVESYLLARIPAAMGGQISVVGPDYLPIGVEAHVVPADPQQAGPVHDAVAEALAGFLHPATGGPEATGWPFGRDVHLSDVAAVVEAVPGVDYVRTLNLLLDNTPQGEVVAVPPDRMVVAGPIRVMLWGGEE